MTVRMLNIMCVWSEGYDLTAPLAALTQLNVEFLKQHPQAPHIYQSGVRYQREGKTRSGKQKEKWLTYPLLLLLRHGDCEDLSAALAACYRVRGIAAIAVARESSIGYHIVVQLPDGTFEDPSRMLGMGQHRDG